MTILEVIKKTSAFLEKKGVESPRLQGELLLAHLLGLPRLKLYLNFDQPVAEPVLDRLRELVQRRGRREPLQYLLGKTGFAGFELSVGPQALIPRPETELLFEYAAKILEGMNPSAPAILDWGTGTGCLAIAMARKFPTATVTAIDISPAALELARSNAQALGVAERVRFLLGDGFAACGSGDSFDLIVSNPPYIPTGEIPQLPPEVRDHDPHLALDGGADGLDCYRRLAAESSPFLRPDGRMLLELGYGQAGAVSELFTARGWIVEGIEKDYSNIERILMVRRA